MDLQLADKKVLITVSSGGIGKQIELIFNCTKGDIALDVVKMAGTENLRGKILIDISNPLDFSKGMPPTLIPALCNTNSLGEEMQKLLSQTNVVKNVEHCKLRSDGGCCKMRRRATMLIAGNNMEAKKEVEKILQQFGWKDILDLGDIKQSRSTEMMLSVWLSIYTATKNGYFGFKIVR